MNKRDMVKNTLFFTPVLLVLILFFLGFKYVIVLTDSMEPTIPSGALVVTAPLEPGNNSVILFNIEIGGHSTLVLHRLVVLNGKAYTKGDNRDIHDPWSIDETDILGVAVLTIPFLGYVFLFLKPLIVPIVAGIVTYIVSSKILCKWREHVCTSNNRTRAIV